MKRVKSVKNKNLAIKAVGRADYRRVLNIASKNRLAKTIAKRDVSLLSPKHQLKVWISPSKKCALIYFNESALKITKKNVFYFVLKALFVLDIFTFSANILVMCKKRLDKKAINFKLISNYDVIDRTTSNYNTEASSWPFSLSGLNVGNFTKFVSIVCPSRGKTRYIKTKVLTTWFYLI